MREAVAHLQASLGMSERRACRVVGADRKSVRYRSTRPDDADLRERLRSLAAERRRFGYRRLHILLRRDGVLVNRKKTQRLYTEEGLTVRKRLPTARCGCQGGTTGAGAAQPALEPGLRARSDGIRAPVPCAEHSRRRDTGVPCRGAGHLDLGTPCGPGAG
jgi:transposase InsO family protein